MGAGAEGDVGNVSSVRALGEALPNLARSPILLEGFFQRGAIARLFMRRVQNTAAEFRSKETANANLDSEVDCGAAEIRRVFVRKESFRLLQVRGCGVGRSVEPLGHFERRVFPAALLLRQLCDKLVDARKQLRVKRTHVPENLG